MLFHVARVRFATRRQKLEKQLCFLPFSSGPVLDAFCRPTWIRSRMHQLLESFRDEPIVNKGILLDSEQGILPFQISCVISPYSMSEDQILGPCRRTNRIGLHEIHASDRPSERCRRKQRTRDRETAKMIERKRLA